MPLRRIVQRQNRARRCFLPRGCADVSQASKKLLKASLCLYCTASFSCSVPCRLVYMYIHVLRDRLGFAALCSMLNSTYMYIAHVYNHTCTCWPVGSFVHNVAM